MREMMLALTDQEGGVGMNESSDRLGQAVSQRLPCLTFQRQQTAQYIFCVSRPFAFILFVVFRKQKVLHFAHIIDFLYVIALQPKNKKKKDISGISFPRCKQLLYSYTDSIKKKYHFYDVNRVIFTIASECVQP